MRRLLRLAPCLAFVLAGTARAGVVTVPYDFLPRTCPNYFRPPHETAVGDTVPTAILGTADLDVRILRQSSLVLIVPGGGGLLGESTTLKPIGFFFKDVARPVDDPTNCKCTGEGADGYEDLVALFDAEDLGKALKDAHDGDRIPVCMEGAFEDETKLQGCDCIFVQLGPLAVDSDTWGRVKATYR
ncbi:MAG: hypothetical protein U0167_17090 [bacterium]